MGVNLILRVNLSDQGVKFLMMYNKIRLLSCLICLARISFRKMSEGNIEQRVLPSAAYDEDMVGYPEDTDQVHEGYREDHATLKDASIPRCSH